MPATSSRNGSANNSQAFAYFGWLTLLVYLANPLGTLVDIQTSYMLKNHLHATATIPGLGRNGGKIDRQAARRLWHVLFHAGIPDLAETLVSTNVEAYLSYFYTSTAYNYSPAVFTKEDIAEYVRVYSSPGALRAGFQYSSTALREDLENLSGCARKLTIPVSAWGGQAFLGNIVPAWQDVANDVRGGEIERCGHFVAEERPEFVIQQAIEFFGPLLERTKNSDG